MTRLMHKTWLRCAALGLGVTLMGGGTGHTEGAPAVQTTDDAVQYRLRIGVRSQARPFSYKSETLADILTAATPGPLARADYTGYMIKICDAVLTDLMLNPPDPGNPLLPNQIETVDIDALLKKAAREEAEIERHNAQIEGLRATLAVLKKTMTEAKQEAPPGDVKAFYEEILRMEGELDVSDGNAPSPLVESEKIKAGPKPDIAVLGETFAALTKRLDKVTGVLLDKEDKFQGIDNVKKTSAQNKGSRFRYLNPADDQGPRRIDILCDPATVTNERRNGLIISPPVYMTGISFITPRTNRPPQSSNECPEIHAENPDRARFLFGVVGNTTAASAGIRALLAANELPEARQALIQFLRRGDDSMDACRLDTAMQARVENSKRNFNARWHGGPVLIFTTHDQAAKAFCDGYVHYYLGDRDIIVETARTIPGCEFDNGTRTFTMDRYGIFGKLDYENPDQAQLVSRFFEILSQKVLSHPSIVDQAFYETFHPNTPTRTLEYFFRSIRGMP